ncbi:hypothetical protein SDC9_66727 [bioreactor metagenome]|uniref:Uncharacterized protein n=1 Tax=bioreactor metagenome TaxID=1076179 RepID=A0A644XWY1_9ZZZZ
MGIIGAEECSVLAIGLNPSGHLLEDVLLGTSNTNVGGRIGSSLKDELHSELLAGGTHDGDAAAHGLIAEVSGERDVHERVTAELVSSADDQIAAGHEVIVDSKVCRGLDYTRVLVSFTSDGDDVGSLLLDAAECLGGAGDCLVDDDRFHLRIVGKAADDADGRFSFIHEVVRIGDVLNDTTTGGRTIFADQPFCTTKVILGLRYGTGDHANVEVCGSRFCRRGFLRSLCKQESCCQKDTKNQSKGLFHFYFSPYVGKFPTYYDT